MNTILPVVIGVSPLVTFASIFIVLPICTSVFIGVRVSVGAGLVAVFVSVVVSLLYVLVPVYVAVMFNSLSAYVVGTAYST